MIQKKVAFVTGASSGIGTSIAELLLSRGWCVFAGARRLDRMEPLRQLGAQLIHLDLCDNASIVSACETVMEQSPHLDALINNAGYGSYGALEDVAWEDVQKQFQVNLFGLARLCQIFLPSMRATDGSTIINVSSVGGKIWMPVGGWYHATKHALEVYSDVLRLEVEPFGIRVVIIEPGGVKTEFSSVSSETLKTTISDSAYARWTKPMLNLMSSYSDSKAITSPERVASVVLKALHSSRPARRYAVGIDAKILLFLYRWLPMWGWEAFLRMAIRP